MATAAELRAEALQLRRLVEHVSSDKAARREILWMAEELERRARNMGNGDGTN